MAEALGESFSLEELERNELENAAALPNVDNLTICSCRGFCLRERGRNFCPCKSIGTFCSTACHEDDETCLNSRRVQESDSEQTVSLFLMLCIVCYIDMQYKST
jgi:hypothetical protein